MSRIRSGWFELNIVGALTTGEAANHARFAALFASGPRQNSNYSIASARFRRAALARRCSTSPQRPGAVCCLVGDAVQHMLTRVGPCGRDSPLLHRLGILLRAIQTGGRTLQRLRVAVGPEDVKHFMVTWVDELVWEGALARLNRRH